MLEQLSPRRRWDRSRQGLEAIRGKEQIPTNATVLVEILAGVICKCFTLRVNWHQVIEARNHEMDEAVATVLQQDPSKLDLVVEWIENRLADPDYSTHSKDALKEWLDLIHQGGLPSVLKVLLDQGEESLRMRQSSPFAVIMPQQERLRILRRYEALRPRARPAGL